MIETTLKKDITKSPYLGGFAMETSDFLEEIVKNALREKMGVLDKPLKIFVSYIEMIAIRCNELRDPVLDKIMCDMALYEQASRYSPDYNKEMIEQVNKNYLEFIKIK